MYRRFVIAATLALGTAAAGQIQAGAPAAEPVQGAEGPIFSARSELVVLHVTVRDRRGNYVTGLGASAFSVTEDGRRQNIQFFAKEDAPVAVGLLIDSSGSMQPTRDLVIAAAGTFAETSNPDDEIFGLAFNDEVRAALPTSTPFTGDPDVLRAALEDTITARGRTRMHDAVIEGLNYLSLSHHLRKVLVLVGDGGDNASVATFEQVLKDVQASNTVIYTVGLIDPVDRDADPRRLRRLANASGGQAFMPDEVSDVSNALRQIARDIRNTYTIGYVPDDATRDGRFRQVRVEAGAPGLGRLTARTRQGYVLGDK